ncbi:MAG TPA: hypothetical protein VIK84_05665 [Haloplasmataceae bacterium]
MTSIAVIIDSNPSLNETIRTFSKITGIIGILLFILLSIIFIIILTKIKYDLSNYRLVLITTLLFAITYISLPIIELIVTPTMSEYAYRFVIYSYATFITTLLFKISLMIEALKYLNLSFIKSE